MVVDRRSALLVVLSFLAIGATRGEARARTVADLVPVFEAALASPAPERSLVVLDLDETTLWTPEGGMPDEWYAEQARLGRSNQEIATFLANRMWACEFLPTMPDLPERLQRLAEKKIPVVFLTARNDQMVEVTERDLLRHRLLAPPSAVPLPRGLAEFFVAARDPRREARRPEGRLFYRSGVLYVGGFDKALGLDLFLAAARWPNPITHLYVADDRHRHLDEFTAHFQDAELALFHVDWAPPSCHTVLAEQAP